MATSLLTTVENRSSVDAWAEAVHRPVQSVLQKRPELRTTLDGTWLGHPLHAALTDFPVGAWATGVVLDIAGLGRPRKKGLHDAAFTAHAFGLAAAGVAALAGLADWSYLDGKPRRVGFVHAALNTVAAGLFGISLLLRKNGRRGAGIAASTTGFAVVMGSAWLGGVMSYHYGIGVSHRAFEQGGPSGFMPVLRNDELAEGQLRRVVAEGAPILLARANGRVHAIGDTCTHLGCSLSRGRLDGERVVCACHGSQFRLRDGRVMVGPATDSEPHYETRVRDGQIEVRRSGLDGAS
ncbi:Rieske 2Fe-2S domain-containing protein [Polyangium spumosum]|uniref:Rieske 2Fe-2S domain-containing protein n=1 Tax=Polyangium spumosum TaxID=889282 RepID=A0A6N7PYK7_9BACT|nr:Rieske 2Fe-2S domain-containing protein [Polyangium spumosum]MRG96979.1 Rieske 2Fe-2S domain-containing protein [Polyangium spumosum]